MASTDPVPEGDLSTSSTTPLWHTMTTDDALAHWHSAINGISQEEATRRLKEYGPNEIGRAPGESRWAMLWRQINNPLIYVLLGAAILAFFTGKTVDALVVVGVVVANALIGFVQETRASQALEALTRLVPELCMVVRASERITVPVREIVPGDVVALASGDKVSADARLIHTKGLRVDEAALTGESVPVEKDTAPVAPDATLGDRRNMLYGGTLVTSGTSLAVVVATGQATELGRISSMLQSTSTIETPLTRKLAEVGKWITISICAVAALLLAVAVWRGHGWTEALLAAITLAVAAIPEGLPAIITIALAIGVQRMAKRHAIVRHLPAVETLGSTTTICSDKTGTLTRNEMTVQAAWTGDGEIWEISGVGYAPHGEFLRDGTPVDATELPADVTMLLTASALCNDAALRREDERWRITGDPTEAALVTAAGKGGVDATAIREKWPRIDTIPFESEQQFMATLHSDDEGSRSRIFMKGAPEVVLRHCASHPVGVRAVLESMAGRGMRVLALAELTRGSADRTLEKEELANMNFVGLIGMIDPPRQEAIDAVAACQRAGVTVKMITGDHPSTAAAIGRQLGLLSDSQALTGRELDHLDSDEALREAVRSTNVFARVAPEHKLRLVRALQTAGDVVAMTGDGVNDAPAVKQADVGIAMGITGTAVSKESAKVILADDNFASIASAVEEGRRIYDNLIKALAFVLPTNIGEALIILCAVMFFPIVGGEALLPMLPVQILWINLVATVALALPLAFEAAEPDVMRRKPRAPDAPVFSRFILFRTVTVAVVMGMGAIGLFLFEFYISRNLAHPVDLAVREAQTMAVTTVVFFQIFYLLNCRSLRDSIFAIGLWSNPAVYVGIGALIALQLGFVYLPWMNALFSSSPLPLDAWIESIAAALIVVPIISLEKWLRRLSKR